ncbi:putative regulator of nonsense transcripts 1 [Symbiodinium microadriaticum]|uniref:Putative regulator of nonsense transcripts 1 n=1 Tax=Symbiodinium microadriaticum TaxID=2951 RepID=A0A1Q9F750_SYMMI|nr:putative regulator of nonsense transcripts 1 [Symbiodinium microadriaticum]
MANTPVAQRRIKVGEKFGIKKSHAKKSIILSYKDDLLTSGRKTLFGMDFKSGNTMKMSTGVSGGGKRAKVSKEEVCILSYPAFPRVASTTDNSSMANPNANLTHQMPAWPFDKPLAVIPVSTPEEKTGHSILGYVNVGEADQVCHLVERVVFSGHAMSEVGIICAYDAQVKLVRQKLRELGITTSRTGRVEVTSVDGFQGREKVRSQSERGVGFLRDWRRANVGLTRARNAYFSG